jgi:hypothetical protein
MFVLAKRTDEKAHRPGLDLSGDVADTAHSKSQLESAVRNPRSPPRVLRFMGRVFCLVPSPSLLLVARIGEETGAQRPTPIRLSEGGIAGSDGIDIAPE